MKGVHDCEIIGQSGVAPGVARTLVKGPEIAREARPGQFVNIRVANTTDPLLRRPLSVHAVYPDEGLYSLLYVLRGRGTAILHKIPPGEKVSVVGPLGRPFDLGDSPDAEHIVVAGGCGAAPLHFLCDALCRKWTSDRVTVLSGARSKDAVLCEAEFRAHGVDVSISTDDGSHGYRGFVTQLLQAHLSNHKSQITHHRLRIYSCGPHAMLKEVWRISREAGAKSCQVSLENAMACGIGVCMGCVQKCAGTKDVSGFGLGDTCQAGPGQNPETSAGWHYKRVCADGPVFEAEEIVWE